MNVNRSIAGLILTLLAGACTVGPEYKAPDLDAPETFVSQDIFRLLNENGESRPASAIWWEGFSDPMLSRLIEETIENNQDVAAAAARVRFAQAELKLADAGNALTVDGSAETGVEGRRELGGDNDNSGNETLFGALGLALPLDVFGRNRREVEAAQASLEAAEADLRSVVLTRSTDVAREYLRLRGSQRQLELLRESVSLQEKTLSVVKSRYEAGLSPELDLRRAETSVERLRADIPPLEESLLNSRNRLANLTGQYPGAFEESLREITAIPAYEQNIPSPVPVDALRQRPDIRRAEAELKRTIAEIGVAESDYYPVFRLFGQMRIGTSGISGQPSMDVIIGSLSALVEQVLIDGGARKAGVARARARADEALANYRQALLDAAQSIETTLAALQSSLNRQQSLEKAVESSARSFSQAENLYQLGLISFLDVVDAQRVLASAEQQLAGERTNYSTEIATLFRVLGARVEN